MSLTFSDLQDELYGRGASYLDQDAAGRARAKRWLNWTYQAICEAYPWPFLETDTSGTPPLTISDLRKVLSVTDSTGNFPIGFVSRETAIADSADLTLTGIPNYYYLENNVLKTYPVSTDTVAVHYIKTPPDLDADSDVPVIPSRYCDIIVDGAVVYAMKDADNYLAVTFAQDQFDQRVQAMANSLLMPSADVDTIG